MPPLDAPLALATRADGHAKFMDQGALDREVLLVLGDDAAAPDRSATVRTLRGQRRLVRHVDARRRP